MAANKNTPHETGQHVTFESTGTVVCSVPVPPPKPYRRQLPDEWELPKDLLNKSRWLTWKAKPRTNGKVDKIPVNPRTAEPCNVTDPESSTDFAVAYDFARQCPEIRGLGFALFSADDIIGGDIDGCIDQDGRLSPLAEELLAVLDTYVEVSPSGRGLRFFGKGSLHHPYINHEQGLEIYTAKRYLTVTGNAIPEKVFALEDIQSEMNDLMDRYGSQHAVAIDEKDNAPDLVDEAKIRSALKTINPDCGYHQWTRVGMALKSTDHPRAFDWWNDWSRKSRDQYPGQTECQKKWQSFRQDGGITVGTLLWMARQPTTTLVSFKESQALEQLIAHLEPYSPHNRGRNDVGNVERFIDLTAGTVRFVPTLDQWIGWQGTRWEALPGVFEVSRRVVNSIYLEAQNETDHDQQTKLFNWGHQSHQKPRLDAMADLARQAQHIQLSDGALDATNKLLGVPNGTVDLSTGELLAPDRDCFITKSTTVPYCPDARCPRWEAFVAEIMDNDPELTAFLHRLAGYALWGTNSEQVVAILYGTGSNGKSTFVNALQQVLGDYFRQVDPASFMASRHQNASGPREDLIRLYRARLVIATEPSEGDRLNEGLIKSVSGGDRLYARALYAKKGIEFTPEFLLMLVTNHKPIVKGTDDAIWRRLRLIPFERTFTDDEQNKHLKEELSAELVGIQRWLVEGCVTWYQTGLCPPERVLGATDNYRTEMDNLAYWIEERCQVDQSAVTLLAALYRDYKEWCESEGTRAPSNAWFGRNLQAKGFTLEKKSGQRARRGIRLRQD